MLPSRSRRRFIAVVLAAMGVNAALLLPALGSKSVWVDEAIGLKIARAGSIAAAYRQYRASEVQPPGNDAFLWIWAHLFGTGEVATRLPYVAMSVACVGLLALLAWRLVEERAALVAVYLLAISPFLLLFGRMSLYYVPTLLLTLLAAITLLGALARGPRWWALHSVVTIALLLTNYTAAAYVLVQLLFGGLVAWGRVPLPHSHPFWSPKDETKRGWLASTAAVVAVFVLWVAVDAPRLTARSLVPRPREILGIMRLVLDAAYPVYAWAVGPTIFPWHPAALAASLVVAVALAAGVYGLAGARSRYAFVALGLLGSMAVVVVTYQLYVQRRPFETVPTRAIFALPFFLMTLAVGLERIGRRTLPVALAVLTISSGFGVVHYFRGTEFHNAVYTVPSREIARTIATRARGGDVVVAESDTEVAFYLGRTSPATCVLEVKFYRKSSGPEVLAALRRTLPPRIWLVTLGRDGTEGLTEPDIERFVAREYHRQASWGYAPQDPRYARIKQRIQGGGGYRYKVTVGLYRSPARGRAWARCPAAD